MENSVMLEDLRRKYHVPVGAKRTVNTGMSLAARRIRSAMIVRNMFAHGILATAGVSPDGVRNIMNGKTAVPRKNTLLAIARILDVPVNFFTDAEMSDDVPTSASVTLSRSTAQPPGKASPILQMLMRGRHLDGVTLGRQNIEVHSGAYTFPEMMLANLSPSVGRPALTRASSDFLPQVRDGDLILVDLLGDPEGDDLVVHAVRGPHGYRWRMSKCREVIALNEGEPPMLRFLGVLSADLGKK